MYERNSNLGSVALAFLLGGLLGAAVALLMAPQSGQEMRSILRDKSGEVKDRAVEAAEGTRSKLDDIAGQAKDKVNTIVSRGQEVAEEQKDRLDEQVKAAKKSMSY